MIKQRRELQNKYNTNPRKLKQFKKNTIVIHSYYIPTSKSEIIAKFIENNGSLRVLGQRLFIENRETCKMRIKEDEKKIIIRNNRGFV